MKIQSEKFENWDELIETHGPDYAQNEIYAVVDFRNSDIVQISFTAEEVLPRPGEDQYFVDIPQNVDAEKIGEYLETDAIVRDIITEAHENIFADDDESFDSAYVYSILRQLEKHLDGNADMTLDFGEGHARAHFFDHCSDEVRADMTDRELEDLVVEQVDGLREGKIHIVLDDMIEFLRSERERLQRAQ